MQQQRSAEEEEEQRRRLDNPSFRKILQDNSTLSGSSAAVPVEYPRVPAVERLHGLVTVEPPVENECDGGDDGGGGSEDFEFDVVARVCLDGLDAVTADEIFSNGFIRPVYPLFNSALVDGGAAAGEAEKPAGVSLQELTIVDRDAPTAPSSEEKDELDALPAGNYCIWTPRSPPLSPDLRKKSHSTGEAASKQSRLCHLIPGRSRSDGREKLVYVAAPTEKQSDKSSADNSGSPRRVKAGHSEAAAAAGEGRKGGGRGRGRGRASEMDVVTAYRLYYARAGPAAGHRRRSFLPYRSGWGFSPV